MKFTLKIEEGTLKKVYTDGTTITAGEFNISPDGQELCFESGETLPYGPYEKLIVLWKKNKAEETIDPLLAPSTLHYLTDVFKQYYTNPAGNGLVADMKHLEELVAFIYEARKANEEELLADKSLALREAIADESLLDQLEFIYGMGSAKENLEALAQALENASKKIDFSIPDNYKVSTNLEAAILYDHKNKDLVCDLVWFEDGTLTIHNLKKHANEAMVEKYWAGIALTYAIEDGATKSPEKVIVKINEKMYEFPVENEVGNPRTGNENGDGLAIYFDAQTAGKKMDLAVQWISPDGRASDITRTSVALDIELNEE